MSITFPAVAVGRTVRSGVGALNSLQPVQILEEFR
jgi:hypothetical protein